MTVRFLPAVNLQVPTGIPIIRPRSGRDPVTARPVVAADDLDGLRSHYDDRQLVEVIVCVGYYFLLARLTTVLDIPIDAPADDTVLRAALQAARAGDGKE